MITWLNNDLALIHPLEATMDAEYHVVGMSFSKPPDRSGMTFRVDVDCLCRNGAECCIPERTFVVILEAMQRNSNTILPYVPPEVSEFIVVCMENHAQVGAVAAPWHDVRGFLQNQITGYELGVHVSRTAVP